jgi:hypothetical protein
MTTTKIYKINEVINAAGQYGYKLGEILNVNGQKVAPSHHIKVKPKKWLETIVSDFIKKPTTPPGVYYVYLYSDHIKKNAADIYPIQIGKPSENLGAPGFPPAPIVFQQPAAQVDHVLSYDQALANIREIESLKAENSRLTAENIRLNAELDAEAEPEAPGLGETAKSFIGQILPMADVWFKDRAAQRQMEFLKIKVAAPKVAAPYENLFLTPPTIAAPPDNTNNILNAAEAYFNTLAPELYAEIEALKEGCKGYQEFFDKIKQANPEVYAQLYTHIKTAGAQ